MLRRTRLVVVGLVALATGCASGGAPVERPSAAVSSYTLLAPVCTHGWACVQQAEQRVGFKLLAPPSTAHFTSVTMFQSSRHTVAVRWTDHGKYITLATYDTLNQELGDVVKVRGTQGHLQVLSKPTDSFLVWRESGRWQVLDGYEETGPEIVAIAESLRASA